MIFANEFDGLLNDYWTGEQYKKELYNLLFDFICIDIVFKQCIYMFYEDIDLNINSSIIVYNNFLAFKIKEL